MIETFARAFAAVVVLGLAAGPPAAHAQNDHYKCYKAKDTNKAFKKAFADLTPLQNEEFAPENCRIKPKAKQVCVPASKTNVSVVEGSDEPFSAQDLTDIQLCYKVKCPKFDRAPLEVSDQFGTRTLEKFKTKRLCVPAVLNQEAP